MPAPQPDTSLINLQSVNKSQLNNLILNYLIVEGYESAAVNFSREVGFDLPGTELRSGVPPRQRARARRSFGGTAATEKHASLANGLQSIKQRNEIKLLLIRGDISAIITKLNQYYPFLLETNDFLYFKILLLNLIEIIKRHQRESNHSSTEAATGGTATGRKKSLADATKKKRRLSSTASLADKKKGSRRKSSLSAVKLSAAELRKEQDFFTTIISFVKDKLFNKAIKNKLFLHELELSMCLLLFDFDEFQAAGDAALLLPKELLNLVNNKSFKNEVFNLINNAILNYNSRYLTLTSSHSIVTETPSSLVTNGATAAAGLASLLSSGPVALRRNSRAALSNDFMNNNEDSKYKNSYVFYDTDDSDSDDNEDTRDDGKGSDGDHEMAPSHSSNNNIDELLFDEGDNDDVDGPTNGNASNPMDDPDLNAAEELNNHYLANNVNSKFKQLINLWIWGENVFNDAEIENVPRVDLEKLLSS